MPQIVSDQILDRIRDNSFRNYHAKGVDYLCFQRSPTLTLKIYFFDNPPAEAQIVNPHDHRYDFATAVICGAATDSIWRLSHENTPGSRPFGCFSYNTPLLGGSGFTYDKLVHMKLDQATRHERGASWNTNHRWVHTLDHIVPGTILALEQYADRVAIGDPTHCYVRHADAAPKAPDLLGLYDRFEADQILARLKQLEAVQPGALSWIKGQ